MMRLVRLAIGGVLIAGGVLGALFALLGVMDPQGSKLADDGDPFGPVSRADGLVALLGYLASIAIGALLLGFRPWRKVTGHQSTP